MKKIICVLLAVVFVLQGVVGASAEQTKIATECYSEDLTVPLEALPADAAVIKDGKLDINAKSAILMEVNTGKILYEQNANERLAPASITKIMSLLLIMEAIDDGRITLETKVSTSEHAASMGGSQIWLEPGEEMTVHDLLRATVIASANDATVALAELLYGSEETFVEKMNEKAAELEMKHTHFTNTTGLQDINHYSSAEDLGAFLKEALKNQAFYEIFTADTYSVAPTNLHPEGFTFHSSMFQTMKESNIQDTYIKGGKTGFTSDAGLCLASLGEVNGKSYILVTAHADGNHDTDPYHILDAVSVYGQLAEQTQPETTTSEDETGSEE